MSKRWLLLVLAFIMLGFVLYRRWTPASPKKIHFHAGFQLYDHDRLVDFSNDRYMHVEPCSIAPQAERADPQGNVHLHNGVGDVAHIHQPGVIWADLFANLAYPIPATVTAYLNGELTPGLLTQPIVENVSAIFIIGPVTDVAQKLAHAVTLEKIKIVEQNVESCGRT